MPAWSQRGSVRHQETASSTCSAEVREPRDIRGARLVEKERTMSSNLTTNDDRQRFLAEMQAAADYITTNVEGQMVPATEVQPIVELSSYLKERATNEDLPSAN